MEMPSVVGEENGQAARAEDANFEQEPSLKVGVHIQNLVKVQFSKFCRSLQESQIQIRYILISQQQDLFRK